MSKHSYNPRFSSSAPVPSPVPPLEAEPAKEYRTVSRKLTQLDIDFHGGRPVLGCDVPPAPPGEGWELEGLTSTQSVIYFSWVRTVPTDEKTT